MTEEELKLQKEKEELEKKEEAKTFTEEEVAKMVQAETDRKTTKALETAREKWEKEFKEKLEAEKSEAEKLGAMTADERAKAEFEAERAQFELDRKTYQLEKLELQTVKELSAEGLPTSFSSYIMADKAEDISINIKNFKSKWEQALSDAVEEKLKGKTPLVQSSTGISITKEQFNKMDYKARVELMEKDSALYEALKK
ncbi:MAG: DUF4355 domain-containing protein [Carnobacterium sp.]|uniref:DUF4355 domain-containing protein n=1 Tax=Carnobacterium sp. TaxID=48221 RepID=UPI003C77160E